MIWNRIYLGQRFVTILLLAIGLSSYGCKDSVSVSEDVQVPLSSLTITPGTLQPGFFSNTANYTFNAPTSATSVTVTAIPKDNTTTVTINKAVTTHLSVPLGGPGSITTITIVLSSSTGGETTYTVNVMRLFSSDNGLSALTVTANNIVQPLTPHFDTSIPDYTVNVANTVNQVTVAATKSDLNAVMQIGSVTVPAGTASGSAPNIPLGGPGTATPVSITVTAPDGSPKTYTVTVNRAASSDDTLSALTVTTNNVVQPLAPDFNASTLGYTVNVANTVDQVTIAATKSDLNAVMQIGSVTVPAGTASGSAPNIPLGGPGTQTVVSISVTAQSGGVPKIYTITVNRAAPASDNNLSALTVTPGTLTPDFASSTTSYSVDVPNSVDSVTVSATKADPNAVMSGDVTAGTGTSTGQETFLLLVPLFPRTVSITVTAPNGDPKTYTIIITRAFP
jgi:hypothetical protein